MQIFAIPGRREAVVFTRQPPSMGRNEQMRPIGFQRFHCVSLHKHLDVVDSISWLLLVIRDGHGSRLCLIRQRSGSNDALIVI